MFDSVESIVAQMAEGVRPPLRMTVTEAAERFRQMVNPGVYVGPWRAATTPYIREFNDVLTSRQFTASIFVGPAQSAKALALDTLIPTPDGWSRMGDLCVGDIVFDEKGLPQEVTVATEIMHGKECFRVNFSNGDSIVADIDHKWKVFDGCNQNSVRVENTGFLFEKQTYRTEKRARFSVPTTRGLMLPPASLPVDPYLLGAWLGDGDSRRPYLTVGRDDAANMLDNLAEIGVKPRVYADTRNGVLSVKLESKSYHLGRGHGGGPISEAFRALGLCGADAPDKFIPHQYLRASEEQRRALLAGLMDTDGTISGPSGRCAFAVKVRQLALDFCELLTTLGYSYCWEESAAGGKPFYRVSFSPMGREQIFRLKRKQARVEGYTPARRPVRQERTTITSIERVGSVPVRCIAVSGESHLYAAGRTMIATHNTDVLFNWLTYSTTCDPADILVYHMTRSSARDFFIRRIDRFYRDSPEVAKHILPGKQNKSMQTTRFASGALLSMSWPSITEMSGKPVPRLWLTDYDRMPMDIDGEGAPFALAKKRATTFKSRGMCVAESSPGFEVDDPRWLRTGAHEAPPTKGILSLYNAGDRRKWYWPCPVCNVAFEPHFSHLKYRTDSEDFMACAEEAYMVCPHCGGVLHHHETENGPGKDALNMLGRWVKEGQQWVPGEGGEGGEITGKARRSDTASFWLNGTAAKFTTWTNLVYNYLKAVNDFVRTGSQESLKVTVNTDQGDPYLPRGSETSRLPEELKERAIPITKGIVPKGVRFLVATIDIQKNRFVVQVHGFGKGGDIWIVDRFDVKLSKRIDPETNQNFWISPASYLEDWYELIPAILVKDYPLEDSKQRMTVKAIGCDSGGREGVTTNAYNFWRFLVAGPDEGTEPPPGWREGIWRRFQLVKGDPNPAAPRVQVRFPDSDRKDRKAGARGEVPILFMNPNILKDSINAMLDRTAPGGGKVSFAYGMPDSFYAELVAEIRTAKGWENPKNLRNEAWDLLYYALALAISRHVGIERIDWENPPSWADEWDKNDLVYLPVEGTPAPFADERKIDMDMTEVAAALL
jgi:phage terminase large subunit GpA-like protein